MSGAGIYVCVSYLSFEFWRGKQKSKAKKGEAKHLGGEAGDIQGWGG